MKSITKDFLIDFIIKKEIELCSTHPKLCVPIINRIYKKMIGGIKFSGIKVDDNIICDGHHRYLASLIANYTLERYPGSKTLATIKVDWENVIFDDEDWDTPAKIRMLNEQDAKFNNISIENIEALLF